MFIDYEYVINPIAEIIYQKAIPNFPNCFYWNFHTMFKETDSQ